MSNRVHTHFGILFPPFKSPKLKAGANTINFAIKGAIVSKKNNFLVILKFDKSIKFIKDTFREKGSMNIKDCFKAIRLVYWKIVGNVHYYKFLEEQKPVITSQMQHYVESLKHKNLSFPLNKAHIKIQLYFKDLYIQDVINKCQTLHDLLKECHVIKDDSVFELPKINGEGAHYKDEIRENLALIFLSFNL